MASEDSKPVKKELESNRKSSVTKKGTNSNPKVSRVKKEEAESKVKKEDYDDNDYNTPLAKTNSNSKEVKKRKKIKEEEKKEEEKKKREKKVYDLPGQKRDPPEEKDPLRIFYESLYNQVPSSEMSQIWLMESGLLPKDVALKVHEKKQKKGLQKLSSPVKSAVATMKSSIKSVTVKKKNRSSSVPGVKRMNSTSKQSKKRKSKDQSSEDKDDNDSDEEVISSVATRRKRA